MKKHRLGVLTTDNVGYPSWSSGENAHNINKMITGEGPQDHND